MKLLNKYVLNEWISAFAATLIATCGILLMEAMYTELQDLVIYGASAHKIFSYYYRVILSVLPTTIPISLFISVLFSLGKLNNNNEIVAMRASGISVQQISAPIIAAGIVLSGICLILNTSISPKAFEKNRRFLTNIKLEYRSKVANTDSVFLASNYTFNNQQQNRLWFIGKFNLKTKECLNVNVYQNNNDNVEILRISANKAIFDPLQNTWTFINGKETQYDKNTKLPVFSKNFDQKIVNNFKETPDLISTFNKKFQDLSFKDLKAMMKNVSDKSSIAQYSVKYYSVLATSLSCIVISILSIPFALTGVRKNPAVGIAKSIGLLFLFYVTTNISHSLGKSGILNYVIAAWLPIILSSTLIVPLFKRVK